MATSSFWLKRLNAPQWTHKANSVCYFFFICHSNNKYLTAAIFVIFLQILSSGYISPVSPNFPPSNDSFHEDYFLSVFFFLTFQNFILKNMALLEQMYLISMELRSSGQKLESPLEIPFLELTTSPNLKVSIARKSYDPKEIFSCIENSRWKTE